ncbi:MAG: DNA methyltransferase [Chloroflexi bacterium]|nr:DNA methyltransferase [Chloroflexota bacterium]
MNPKPISQNTLFYGDNLPILREYLSDESVDLIYLDPPFNSNRSYNVLFKDESGVEAEAQITAFDDTWHWNSAAEETYHELVENGSAKVATMMSALRDFIGNNQMMAYLVMMAVRLVELHRVLKPTGSLYLHCDPTASHYLKIVLDTIFGVKNFQNEVVWKRFNFHADANRYGRVADRILFYTKSDEYTFNKLFVGYSDWYLENKFDHFDEKGRFSLDNLNPPGGRGPVYEFHGVTKAWRFTQEKMLALDEEGRIYFDSKVPRLKRYLEELRGQAVHDTWIDIPPINSQAAERLGYPTQKPLALLERIIQASSNEGDLVLDPFCGCGTAVVAAQKLNRKWIGIDITHLSITLMKYRLKDNFNLIEKQDYVVIGEPGDLADARQLSHDDRYQFQWWALSLVQAKPLGGVGGREGKKGSDKGVDGVLNFLDAKGKMERVLIQVKSGHVNSGMIRDLRGTVEREGAAVGVFITLDPPTSDMTTEAVSAGYHQRGLKGNQHAGQMWEKDIPRIQILSIEDLFAGKGIEMPPSAYGTFKQAEKIKKKEGTQLTLGEE